METPSKIKDLHCEYCKRKVDELVLKSSWGDSDEQHYKNLKCSKCGKKIWVKTDFMGSGHDHDDEDLSELESILWKTPREFKATSCPI